MTDFEQDHSGLPVRLKARSAEVSQRQADISGKQVLGCSKWDSLNTPPNKPKVNLLKVPRDREL